MRHHKLEINDDSQPNFFLKEVHYSNTDPEHGDERKADRIPSHFNVQITSWVVSITVDSGNSERLNSEQSLISEHFWWHRLFYNINYMLNSELHKICQPLISELKFWNFPLFYCIIYTIYVNKSYLCPKNGKTICYGVLWILQLIKTKI